MKLFEAIWRQGYDYYERYSENSESKVRKIDTKSEYFLPHPEGPYKYILDNSIRLIRKTGRPQDEKIYGLLSAEYVHIRENYWREHDSKYNVKPCLWYIDIETTAYGKIDVQNTPEEVVLIQIYDTVKKCMYVLGSKDWRAEEDYKKEYNFDCKYINCKDEKGIFEMLFFLIEKLKPLIVFGWNTDGFDYPYLFNRCNKIGLNSNRFSPFHNTGGKANLKSDIMDNGMVINKLEASGIYYMDYMDIYKKYTYKPQVSYSLDNIASVELGKNKINHNMYSTFDGLRTGDSYIFPDKEPKDDFDLKMYKLQVKFRDNPTPDIKSEIEMLANDLFVHYGAIDTFLVKELDDKLQLSSILLMIASKMGVTISDTLGTVKPWASYISNKSFMNYDILPHNKVDDDADTSIKGGFVADPQKGKHEWEVSVDINSAYPNLSMRGFNMSPETYITPSDMPTELREMNAKYFSDEDEEARFKLYLEEPEIFNKYTELLIKYNMSASVSGACFDRSGIGIIPTLVADLYAERKKQKNQMFIHEQEKIRLKSIGEDYSHEEYMENQCNTAQMVSKVLINSLKS